MSAELIHTSVPRGLRGGSGFATAVATRSLPTGLEGVLAELSGYDHDANRSVGADEVDWAHRILSIGGKSFTVLSRTQPCANDASGRPNRLAHFLLVEVAERTKAGPAWMIESFESFADLVPPVEERALGPNLPRGDLEARPANAWEAAGFDRGWAGVVARNLLDAPNSICYVVLPRVLPTLPLVCDVLALIPAERRWLVTFSTRWQRMPNAAKCQLRFVRAGATGLRSLLNEPGVRQVVVLEDTKPEPSAAVEAARDGRTVEPLVQQPPSPRVHPVGQPVAQIREHDVPAHRPPQPPLELQSSAPVSRVPELSFSSAEDRGLFGVGSPAPPPTMARLTAPNATSNSHAMISVALFIYSGCALIAALVFFALSFTSR